MQMNFRVLTAFTRERPNCFCEGAPLAAVGWSEATNKLFYACHNWGDKGADKCVYHVEDIITVLPMKAIQPEVVLCECNPPQVARLCESFRATFYGCAAWKSAQDRGCGLFRPLAETIQNTTVMCKCEPPVLAKVFTYKGKPHYGCVNWTPNDPACKFLQEIDYHAMIPAGVKRRKTTFSRAMLRENPARRFRRAPIPMIAQQ